MEASIELIKELRSTTGAGVGAVREALAASNTMEEAVRFLRQKGVAKAEKRAGKDATEGILGLYKHTDNKFMVIVDVATETDFAARSESLVKFANDLALHIAAMNTDYISESSVPAEIVKEEKLVAEKSLADKPKEIAEKILEGKLAKFYEQNVLLNQKLFSDDSKTVQDYLNEIVAKVGEKVIVKKIIKTRLGQETVISDYQE